MGTAVGSELFNNYGWRPAAAVNLAWSGFMLFIILIRGPHVPRYTWVGWKGGLEVRKRKLVELRRKQEEEDIDVAVASRNSDSADEKRRLKENTKSEDEKKRHGKDEDGEAIISESSPEQNLAHSPEHDPSSFV